MFSLRLLPLFALPVLGGVLLAFVVATFQDDPEVATQTATQVDEPVDPDTESAAQEPAQTPEETESVIDPGPAPDPDPLANLNFDGPFDTDRFNDYWRGNISPELAEILENGFPGRAYQP